MKLSQETLATSLEAIEDRKQVIESADSSEFLSEFLSEYGRLCLAEKELLQAEKDDAKYNAEGIFNDTTESIRYTLDSIADNGINALHVQDLQRFTAIIDCYQSGDYYAVNELGADND